MHKAPLCSYLYVKMAPAFSQPVSPPPGSATPHCAGLHSSETLAPGLTPSSAMPWLPLIRGDFSTNNVSELTNVLTPQYLTILTSGNTHLHAVK